MHRYILISAGVIALLLCVILYGSVKLYKLSSALEASTVQVRTLEAAQKAAQERTARINSELQAMTSRNKELSNAIDHAIRSTQENLKWGSTTVPDAVQQQLCKLVPKNAGCAPSGSMPAP